MTMDKFDKTGKVISLEEWGKLFQDKDYKIIKQETLPNGEWVSTVWLGIDHNFSNSGKPLIFETMVFKKDNRDELDMERYATLEEAEQGHKAMVEKWKGELKND